MERRGLLLREDGRILSLIVLHATNDLPQVPAAEVVRIGPPVDNAPLPPAPAFGIAAIDAVLGGPCVDTDRDHVVLQASLFRVAIPLQAGTTTVSALDGVGVVESSWGVSAFRLTGTLTIQPGVPVRLELSAARVSGFDGGPWTLSFRADEPWHGDEAASVLAKAAHFSDAVNPALSMRLDLTGLTADGPLLRCRLQATGEGFRYASFLASGESLGGAEGVY